MSSNSISSQNPLYQLVSNNRGFIMGASAVGITALIGFLVKRALDNQASRNQAADLRDFQTFADARIASIKPPSNTLSNLGIVFQMHFNPQLSDIDFDPQEAIDDWKNAHRS